MVGTTTYFDSTNNTNCTISYSYCLRVNYYTGFHEIVLENISICGCDTSIFSSSLVDSVLWAVMRGSSVVAWLGYSEIPYCPSGLCSVNVYDLICFSNWFKNPITGCWEMNKCNDGLIRSCNEVIYVCYDKMTGKRVVMRSGYVTGEPCKNGCRPSCQ